MPYIKNHRKIVIKQALEEVTTLLERVKSSDDPKYLTIKPGDLNCIVTLIILAYWKNRGNYQAINDIKGALGNAYNEFYRRVAIPYENKKIKENGDVYDYLKKPIRITPVKRRKLADKMKARWERRKRIMEKNK